MQVDERSLEGLLDNIFGVFTDSRVAQRKRKNPRPVAPDEYLKCQFISAFGGSDKGLISTWITEGSQSHVFCSRPHSKNSSYCSSSVVWIVFGPSRVRIRVTTVAASH